jgi:hypothetical protein
MYLDPKYVTDYANGFVKLSLNIHQMIFAFLILFIGLYAIVNRLIRKIMIKGI